MSDLIDVRFIWTHKNLTGIEIQRNVSRKAPLAFVCAQARERVRERFGFYPTKTTMERLK